MIGSAILYVYFILWGGGYEPLDTMRFSNMEECHAYVHQHGFTDHETEKGFVVYVCEDF